MRLSLGLCGGGFHRLQLDETLIRVGLSIRRAEGNGETERGHSDRC